MGVIKVDEKPIIKKYVLKIDPLGDISMTIDLNKIPSKEKNDILSVVFSQGLKRLGYERS